MPETQKPKLGFCLLAGALAGFINGFFGAGGGMVLVPLLLWLVRLEDKAAFSSAFCRAEKKGENSWIAPSEIELESLETGVTMAAASRWGIVAMPPLAAA